MLYLHSYQGTFYKLFSGNLLDYSFSHALGYQRGPYHLQTTVAWVILIYLNLRVPTLETWDAELW